VSSQLLRALEDSFQILLGILQKYSSNFRTPLKKTEAQRFLKVLSLLFFFSDHGQFGPDEGPGHPRRNHAYDIQRAFYRYVISIIIDILNLFVC
jgi:hypothetical protein